MKAIYTVLKKEIKASFREKRTLMTVLILPAILFPLLFISVFKIQSSILKENNARNIKIAIINSFFSKEIDFFEDPKWEVNTNISYEEAIVALNAGDLDVLIDFEKGIAQKINNKQPVNATIVYKSSDNTVYKKTVKKIEKLNNYFRKQRLTELHIDEQLLSPITITSKNLSLKKEVMIELAGGYLPYMFVIFLFMGCMYPAIDLTTGEKEKHTMETLLTTPVSRLHILLGKIFAMTLFGLLSAMVTIFGVFLFVKFVGELPEEIGEILQGILTLKFIMLLMGMLIPLAFFFASILSWLAITASSFKEAQSRIQPIMFTMFLPVMVALLPGVVLNWKTAIIPILNVSLTTKALMLDAVNYNLYALSVITLIGIAFLAILLSYKRFSNESVVLN